MFFSFWTIVVLVLISVALISVSYVGDYLLLPSNYFSQTDRRLVRCFLDSSMHASTAGMSWLLVIYPPHQHLKQQPHDSIFFGYGGLVSVFVEVLLCAAISSLIDLDHFLEAGSFSLGKALSLSRRPPLHNTSVIILTSIVLLLISRFTDLRFLKVLPFIFFISTLTHHLRDCTRRGLWIAPFGSTPALNYNIYLISIFVLVILVRYLLKVFSTADVNSNLNDSMLNV